MRTPPGWSAEREDPREQLVDQLVRELAHKVALPVVPVLAVGRVEHALLIEERLEAQAVLHEPGCRAQQAQLLGIRVRTRVAGCHREFRRQ